MRILLDQAVHHHRNKGNNSLLEVALDRFREFWPDASFDVISDSPHLCRMFFSETQPVSPYDLEPYESSAFDALRRVLPGSIWQFAFELREGIYRRTGLLLTPGQIRRSLSWLAGANPRKLNSTECDSEPETGSESAALAEASPYSYRRMADYDLYVSTGGGYMVDCDKQFLLRVFNRLEAAIALGVPAVMVGQGVGPIEDIELRQRARDVLPHADYILIREEGFARPLLDSIDVPRSKVIMTGDDAIEPAYQARREALGAAIGLSVRVAPYTAMREEQIGALRRVVLRAAREHSAELLAAPIDVNDSDNSYIEHIMRGHTRTSRSRRLYETPKETIRRIGRCRIMISGTFHGAVFALSQGIPVVAPANTTVYLEKLSGLAAEFGAEGCQVVDMGAADLEDKMLKAINFAWTSADTLRPQLLADAQRQIDLGQAAYRKIYELVEHRNQPENTARQAVTD